MTEQMPELWWTPEMAVVIERGYDGVLRGPGWKYDELPADAVQLAPVGPTPCCTNGQKEINRLADENERLSRDLKSFTERNITLRAERDAALNEVKALAIGRAEIRAVMADFEHVGPRTPVAMLRDIAAILARKDASNE